MNEHQRTGKLQCFCGVGMETCNYTRPSVACLGALQIKFIFISSVIIIIIIDIIIIIIDIIIIIILLLIIIDIIIIISKWMRKYSALVQLGVVDERVGRMGWMRLMGR